VLVDSAESLGAGVVPAGADADRPPSLAESVRGFEEELVTLVGTIAELPERPDPGPLQRAWAAHREALRPLLEAEEQGADLPVPLPAVMSTRDDVRRELLDFVLKVQTSTARVEAGIRTAARQYVLLVAGLTTAGMLVALFFHYRVTGMILRPLARINRLLDRAGLGMVGTRLPLQRDDTVNRLAVSCNRLLDTMQQMSAESNRRIAGERQIAGALAESWESPLVVMTPGGEILLANAGARSALTGADGAEVLSALRKALETQAGHAVAGGVRYRVDTPKLHEGISFPGRIVAFVREPAGA
jgi:HAMP domain-containing protein